MKLFFILHDIKMSIPFFSFAIRFSEEEVYSLFLAGFLSFCYRSTTEYGADGCTAVKVKRWRWASVDHS